VELSLRVRVHSGDPNAFRELFDLYARSVYNHAYRLTGNWSTAEDVVSLTYLEAWRLRERVDTGDEVFTLRSWLLGVATNVARNVRRAARRHDAMVTRLPHPDVIPDIADEVAVGVDDRDRLALVMKALEKLRKPEREVLALCVWSGLEYAEAAKVLGVPVGTVRSRLSRARTKLAKLVACGALPTPEKNREPMPRHGQIKSDRKIAARLTQETAR
jgi:RNA polymerase sigma factor (sigma-70 family)